MLWITPTEAGVLTKLSSPELQAMKTAAIAPGQPSPLTESIDLVVREIRGYVAACSKNVLGPVGTIPSELELAALNRIRYELATRLPVPGLLTEARVESNRSAISQLKEVAACRFVIVPAETPAPEQASGAAGEIVSTSCRKSTRRNLDRL